MGTAGERDWHVQAWGEGPESWALHGFFGSGADWGPLAECSGLRLRTVDLPGHGAHRGDPDQTVEDIADGVAAATTPGPFIGYSFGGRVALALAARHPGHVRRLALIAASPGLADADARRERRRWDEQQAAAAEQLGAAAFAARWEAMPLLATQARMPATWKRALAARRATADPCGLAASLRTAGTGSMRPLWDALPRLSVPVTLIVGAEDVRYRAIAVAMAARLPDAAIEVVEGAGHAAHLEAPALVGPLLRRWAAG